MILFLGPMGKEQCPLEFLSPCLGVMVTVSSEGSAPAPGLQAMER